MKTLTAKLKKEPVVTLQFVDIFKEHDWLTASTYIENRKKEMFLDLKSRLHEQITILSIDDVDFKIEEGSPEEIPGFEGTREALNNL